MTVAQAAAEAVALVERARSLFGPSPLQTAPAGAQLHTASESVGDTGRRTADLSGDLIDRHSEFVTGQTQRLSDAGRTDSALESQLSAAVAATQAGARQMDAIAAQTRVIAQSAATAQTPAAQRTVLAALRSQVAQANDVVNSTQRQAGDIAGHVRALSYGSGSRSEAVGSGHGDAPQTPASGDPPHGKDPRYWVDVTKIIHVPPSQTAPYGYTQIGPDLYYPYQDNSLTMHDPPPPAQYPLDISKITTVKPGGLGPYGTSELIPGVFVPDPRQSYQPEPPWGAPQQPIDVRDVIHVPPGQLAPSNYVEYLPGWWCPD
ncbi:DUF4226 domain-containing protein [Mycobacterium sp. JS623]|uniref:DUF4226 domain-containing protein n=1 Tax=Mycobacterium sp. JS623 TaxID=212767 RepID=UPI0002D95BCD|nr:DUF4226 domain-containing protein [Mycobacterium sp. JS623]